MGSKINPIGMRIGINKNWVSRWNAPKNGKEVGAWLVEDEKIRNYIEKNYSVAQIVKTEIERKNKMINVFISCGQPGAVLGKEGANIPIVTLAINKIVGRKIKVNVNVLTYENACWSARVIAREVADAIENRTPFRVAQKNAIKKVMSAKAIGCKTVVSGRLGGVEMARTEGYTEGMIPLTTLRADIDYALELAHTPLGIIGCKVWINRGEIFGKGLNGQVVPPKYVPFERNNRFGNNRDNKPNNNTTKGAH